MKNEKTPYSSLGERLKSLRDKRNATPEEVSGAVEIDEASLANYETGLERPSEDILMLLINFFDMREDEAATMWKLAGYEVPKIETDDDDEDDRPESIKDAMQNGHTAVMMMAFDPRIIYSDGVDITANQQGVVLNFTQGNAGEKMGRMPIARIGMSYEQAQAVIGVMQKTMQQAQDMNRNNQKQLPSQSSASDQPKKKDT